MKNKTLIILGVIMALFMTAVGCKFANNPANPPQAKKYSNQINALDGTVYTALTTAQVALNGLRPVISTQYPKFDVQFNQAVTSYNQALATYKVFRANPSNSQDITAEAGVLTTAIVQLEYAFQVQMGTAAKANSLRSRAVKANIDMTTIFSELQLAATVAAGIPVSAPYGALAEVLIAVAQQGYNLYNASATINVDSLQPVALIPITVQS